MTWTIVYVAMLSLMCVAAVAEVFTPRVQFKFEPRDVWVGLFWDRRESGLCFWVCLVPCLVIIIRPKEPRA